MRISRYIELPDGHLIDMHAPDVRISFHYDIYIKPRSVYEPYSPFPDYERPGSGQLTIDCPQLAASYSFRRLRTRGALLRPVYE